MAVVPYSQVKLVQLRRQIREALDLGDWRRVKVTDRLLGEQLREASRDPGRDPGELLREVRAILNLYRDLVEACRGQGQGAVPKAKH